MMPAVVRCWLAFAALGAGLIHLALVLRAPAPIAVALVGLAVAELVWAIAALRGDDAPVPRLAMLVGSASAAGWAMLIVVDASAVSGLAMGIATLFDVGVAVALAARSRRAADRRADAARPAAVGTAGDATSETALPPRAGRFVLGIGAGALVVGALTTPALAASEAGEHAQPHGTFHSDH
jgi:hypothetical protein